MHKKEIHTATFNNLKTEYDVAKMFNREWQPILKNLVNTEYFKKMMTVLGSLYAESGLSLEPALSEDLFRPFQSTDPSEIEVVILGDEPLSHSNGLLFGTDSSHNNAIIQKHNDLPLSHNELSSKTQFFDASLESWCAKKVLPLNISLVNVKGYPKMCSLVSRLFIKNVLQYLYLIKGSDLIVVSTGPDTDAALQPTGISEANIIKTTGFFHLRGQLGGNIYHEINRKRAEKNQPPIDF